MLAYNKFYCLQLYMFSVELAGPNLEVIVGSVGAVVIVIVTVVCVMTLVIFVGWLYSHRSREMSSI